MHEGRSSMNQPIDSRQLRAFLALVKAESFTHAAKELHLSQSAVSHSMKALEADLGCRLFDRVGKTVSLTLEGEHLVESAEKILHEMGEVRQTLQQLGQWGRSRLRLGATTTACQYILPSVLREFKESFPQCQITIEPADSPVLIDLIRAQRIDLAVTLEPKPDEALLFHPLFGDELKFVVSPLHPWAVAAAWPGTRSASRTSFSTVGKASPTRSWPAISPTKRSSFSTSWSWAAWKRSRRW
jgi:LysR family transcriptional regulator, low CO2-responsive transcriptional regulator